MGKIEKVIVALENDGLRLDQFLSLAFPKYSRTIFQTLIDEGSVFVSGLPQKKRYLVAAGDEITFEIPEEKPISLTPEAIPLTILYEDECMVVLNKPPHLVVHPGAGNWSGTVVHGLLHHVKSLDHDDPIRPGIVHRLDKDTSGVLITAKNSTIHRALSNQFAQREVEKRYTAIVRGRMDKAQTIDSPIGRDPRNRLKMAVVPTGKPAVSIITPLEKLPSATVVDIQLVTGRTHQIRVHLSHIGFPILGDRLYGGGKQLSSSILVERQMLHCRMIALQHPESKQRMVFEAPLPEDMQMLLSQLKRL